MAAPDDHLFINKYVQYQLVDSAILVFEFTGRFHDDKSGAGDLVMFV